VVFLPLRKTTEKDEKVMGVEELGSLNASTRDEFAKCTG